MNYSGKLRNMASIYIRRGDRILLLFRQGNSIVSNTWIGSAGGHFKNTEVNDAKACMLRELSEELNITEDALDNISLRYITIRHANGEIRQNYYYFADLSDHTIDTPPSAEGITCWFSLNELSDLPMPFTARHMIDHYIQIGQFDDKLYGGIANDAGVLFQTL